MAREGGSSDAYVQALQSGGSQGGVKGGGGGAGVSRNASKRSHTSTLRTAVSYDPYAATLRSGTSQISVEEVRSRRPSTKPKKGEESAKPIPTKTMQKRASGFPLADLKTILRAQQEMQTDLNEKEVQIHRTDEGEGGAHVGSIRAKDTQDGEIRPKHLSSVRKSTLRKEDLEDSPPALYSQREPWDFSDFATPTKGVSSPITPGRSLKAEPSPTYVFTVTDSGRKIEFDTHGVPLKNDAAYNNWAGSLYYDRDPKDLFKTMDEYNLTAFAKKQRMVEERRKQKEKEKQDEMAECTFNPKAAIARERKKNGAKPIKREEKEKEKKVPEGVDSPKVEKDDDDAEKETVPTEAQTELDAAEKEIEGGEEEEEGKNTVTEKPQLHNLLVAEDDEDDDDFLSNASDSIKAKSHHSASTERLDTPEPPQAPPVSQIEKKVEEVEEEEEEEMSLSLESQFAEKALPYYGLWVGSVKKTYFFAKFGGKVMVLWLKAMGWGVVVKPTAAIYYLGLKVRQRKRNRNDDADDSSSDSDDDDSKGTSLLSLGVAFFIYLIFFVLPTVLLYIPDLSSEAHDAAFGIFSAFFCIFLLVNIILDERHPFGFRFDSFHLANFQDGTENLKTKKKSKKSKKRKEGDDDDDDDDTSTSSSASASPPSPEVASTSGGECISFLDVVFAALDGLFLMLMCFLPELDQNDAADSAILATINEAISDYSVQGADYANLSGTVRLATAVEDSSLVHSSFWMKDAAEAMFFMFSPLQVGQVLVSIICLICIAFINYKAYVKVHLIYLCADGEEREEFNEKRESKGFFEAYDEVVVRSEGEWALEKEICYKDGGGGGGSLVHYNMRHVEQQIFLRIWLLILSVRLMVGNSMCTGGTQYSHEALLSFLSTLNTQPFVANTTAAFATTTTTVHYTDSDTECYDIIHGALGVLSSLIVISYVGFSAFFFRKKDGIRGAVVITTVIIATKLHDSSAKGVVHGVLCICAIVLMCVALFCTVMPPNSTVNPNGRYTFRRTAKLEFVWAFSMLLSCFASILVSHTNQPDVATALLSVAFVLPIIYSVLVYRATFSSKKHLPYSNSAVSMIGDGVRSPRDPREKKAGRSSRPKTASKASGSPGSPPMGQPKSMVPPTEDRARSARKRKGGESRRHSSPQRNGRYKGTPQTVPLQAQGSNPNPLAEVGMSPQRGRPPLPPVQRTYSKSPSQPSLAQGGGGGGGQQPAVSPAHSSQSVYISEAGKSPLAQFTPSGGARGGGGGGGAAPFMLDASPSPVRGGGGGGGGRGAKRKPVKRPRIPRLGEPQMVNLPPSKR